MAGVVGISLTNRFRSQLNEKGLTFIDAGENDMEGFLAECRGGQAVEPEVDHLVPHHLSQPPSFQKTPSHWVM